LTSLATSKVIPVSVNTFDSKTFLFQPLNALQNGNYRLSVSAADLLDNWATYSYDFIVSLPDTGVYLVRPRIGVSNTTTFDILVVTTRPSVCKQKASLIESFDALGAILFDSTGTNEHLIKDYSVQEDIPRQLFVVCRDNLGRDNFRDYMLYSDTVSPVIDFVDFDPSRVVEYPVSGPIKTRMHVRASEDVICKYSNDSGASYVSMLSFERFDLQNFSAYSKDVYVDLIFPDDTVKRTFPFVVECEDRAGYHTQMFSASVEVDLTAALQIRVNSPPPATRNTSIFLNITTNKLAYCKYKTATKGYDQGVMSSSPVSLARTHSAPFGIVASGAYTVTFYCFSDQSGAPEEIELPYTFIVDNLPPSAPVINATPTICLNTFKANFNATDAQSGVSYYVWEVGPQGAAVPTVATVGVALGGVGVQSAQTASNILASGNTTATSLSVNKNNNGGNFNLSPTTNYVFTIRAVDKAGNVGPSAQSGPMRVDATGMSCDKTPPSVKLERSTSVFGDAVTLACTDTESGCDNSKLQYNAVYLPPCNASLIYLTPIPISSTTIVCYKAVDMAGNFAIGQQTFVFNKTGVAAVCEGGTDSDGDGYGLGCASGPDCNDKDPLLFVGCPNGCIEDSDGDGYGPGCINGMDCNGIDANLNKVCANGCFDDGDGDGYGLGCDAGPDCQGRDPKLNTICPNGCIVDNDGDGFGVGCLPGLDCNDIDDKLAGFCPNGCALDLDGDGFGLGCTAGDDCAGQNPKTAEACVDGCLSDNDGDGLGRLCVAGLDCDDLNPLQGKADCPSGCIEDNDGDGAGWGCLSVDCDDSSRSLSLDCSITTNCEYDGDGDGYGLGCINGADCDDHNKKVHNAFVGGNGTCTANCTYDVDCNAIPDEWQLQFFNSTVCVDLLLCGPLADPDGDGITNIDEYRQGTDPWVKDQEPQKPMEQQVAETIDPDADNDGMLDAWERRYGLDPSDPFDANKDKDGDGLTNKFEHDFKEGSCIDGLDPSKPDTDDDGYSDKEEVDAKTDPCDPESHPGGGLLPIILMVLGVLSQVGSVGYLIYKNYYLPLITPPSPKPAVGAAGTLGARPGMIPGRLMPQAAPRRIPARPRRTGPEMSREKFLEEARRRQEAREKYLSVFGERRKAPGKVMEDIARRPVEKVPGVAASRGAAAVGVASEISPQVAKRLEKKDISEDHIARLSKIIEGEAFSKLTTLSGDNVDDFERLAKIASRKEGAKLGEDHVAKLASITKKVEDKEQLDRVAAAMKETPLSEFDRLDDMLSKRSPKTEGGKVGVAGKDAAFDALTSLSKDKRDVILKELSSLSESKARLAESKIEMLAQAKSKGELLKEFESIARQKAMDKNVFEVILSFLLKTGKISKRDVSELLFDLEREGILGTADVAEVFFNLGVERTGVGK
jgi:hypothetical protein